MAGLERVAAASSGHDQRPCNLARKIPITVQLQPKDVTWRRYAGDRKVPFFGDVLMSLCAVGEALEESRRHLEASRRHLDALCGRIAEGNEVIELCRLGLRQRWPKNDSAALAPKSVVQSKAVLV
jgi:hypothetical protein